MTGQPYPLRSGWTAAALALLVLAAAALAWRLGSAQMDWPTFWGGITRREGLGVISTILYAVRLPRLIGAVLAGVGLSVAGVLLQAVTGNDLASPNIIGVNAGAGLAVLLCLIAAPHAIYLLPPAAFCGAFLTTLLILSISRRLDSSRLTVVLAGVACNAVLNAAISFLSLLDTDALASYASFSVGGLAGMTLEKLALPALIIAAGLVAALALSRGIDLLCLGDGVARSLGLRVARTRTACLVIASASAAAVVSFAGLLGFVGLIVPHMAKRLVGGRTSWQLIFSALLGAILLLVADTLGRVLFAPTEVPVGIWMALLGAPVFFFLLLRRKGAGPCSL